MRALVDAGGRVGPEEAIERYFKAIDRYYNTPQPHFGKPKQLDLPLKLVISHIWGSADKSQPHP